jgi:hypothetical protein
MKHIWTVPCRFSIRDGDTNNVSLIEVFEEVSVPIASAPPPDNQFVPAVFDVVTLWARELDEQPEMGFGRMSLMTPSGGMVLDQSFTIDLQAFNRYRSVVRVQGFSVQDSGRYQIQIERKSKDANPWEPVASVPLWVTVLRQPTSQFAATSGQT